MLSELLAKAFDSAIRREMPFTPPVGTSDGIASLEPIDLHGCTQWLLIRGHHVSKPLLLFLHGGPGSAAIWFAHHSMRKVEEHFVCVNWDQRGAGKSFRAGLLDERTTIEQFVEDAIALIEMLLMRFNQKKLLLLGQSWGSVLSMKIAGARPDLVEAVVGMGQVVDMMEGEEISYNYALESARRVNSARGVRQLQRIGHPPYKGNDLFIQRRWLSEFKGDTWSIDAKTVVSLGLRATEYSIADCVRFFLGAKASIQRLWNQLMNVSLPRDVPELAVPVVFFVGRHDYTTPFELVEAYFESLRAPAKRLVWFEHSAHMPNLEEPNKFQHELIAIGREIFADFGRSPPPCDERREAALPSHGYPGPDA
jgi:pimeloyl-ACP methyl ester carboxylesterase